MNLKSLVGLIIIYCLPVAALSQEQPSVTDKIINFPSSFFAKINDKTAKLEARLTKQTERYLQRLARREKKLKRKLSKTDSVAAKKLFADSEEQYARFSNMMSSKAEGTTRAGEYIPAKVLSDYHIMNAAGTTQGQGIYVITDSYWVASMGGSGGSTTTSYYDVATNKLIGSTYEHY